MFDDDSVNENDPTKPMPPAWQSGGNNQGKLVIGNFQDLPRQPYSYPPQQRQSQQSSQAQQPTVPAGYPQRRPIPPGQQGYVAQSAPAATPGVQGYPFSQPGQAFTAFSARLPGGPASCLCDCRLCRLYGPAGTGLWLCHLDPGPFEHPDQLHEHHQPCEYPGDGLRWRQSPGREPDRFANCNEPAATKPSHNIDLRAT